MSKLKGNILNVIRDIVKKYPNFTELQIDPMFCPYCDKEIQFSEEKIMEIVQSTEIDEEDGSFKFFNDCPYCKNPTIVKYEIFIRTDVKNQMNEPDGYEIPSDPSKEQLYKKIENAIMEHLEVPDKPKKKEEIINALINYYSFADIVFCLDKLWNKDHKIGRRFFRVCGVCNMFMFYDLEKGTYVCTNCGPVHGSSEKQYELGFYRYYKVRGGIT